MRISLLLRCYNLLFPAHVCGFNISLFITVFSISISKQAAALPSGLGCELHCFQYFWISNLFLPFSTYSFLLQSQSCCLHRAQFAISIYYLSNSCLLQVKLLNTSDKINIYKRHWHEHVSTITVVSRHPFVSTLELSESVRWTFRKRKCGFFPSSSC